MKNKIKPEELPIVFDEEIISVLAYMASHIPILEEWRIISKKLTTEQRIIVNNKICEIQTLESEQYKSQMTEEEKFEDEQKKQALRKKLEEDPHYFFGNMSRPDTADEFKSRFGVWPDGTDGETYNPKK